MKTVKLGEEIRRVADKDAITLVRQGWEYCPKTVWKETVRTTKPVEKTETETEGEKKNKGNLKGKAKKNAK